MREIADINLVIGYKNFAANQGVSHIGLGVSSMNTVKTLNRLGIRAHVHPLVREQDIFEYMAKNQDVSHFIVAAPWISTNAFSRLCHMYPQTQFGFVCHSNVGFLQADTNGIKLVREGLALEQGTHNFHVCGNSTRFKEWIENTFRTPCVFLPNLYFLPSSIDFRPPWFRGILRIGCFGATRPLKNPISSIAAAMEIAEALKADTEIWINSNREEGGAKHLRNAMHALVDGKPGVTLKELPWCPWPEFRKHVGNMHLLLQPSYTESFNMVTADGICMGVPSVVSNAIDWVPDRWAAKADDVNDIATVGLSLLNDNRAAKYGYEALKQYVHEGIVHWVRFLSGRRHRLDWASRLMEELL